MLAGRNFDAGKPQPIGDLRENHRRAAPCRRPPDELETQPNPLLPAPAAVCRAAALTAGRRPAEAPGDGPRGSVWRVANGQSIGPACNLPKWHNRVAGGGKRWPNP